MKIVLTHQFFTNRSYTRQLDRWWNRPLTVTQLVAEDPQTGRVFLLDPDEAEIMKPLPTELPKK